MKFGTTAFSFTNEWLGRQLTLRQLLRRVADLERGPGIELVGFQTWRGFPALTRDEVLEFH
ncbi:MAG: sugar phosphate isomerase/epimerase family protein, partial [Gaiellaceae bacterium]